MTTERYRAQFERTSFGTAKATAARKSITASAAAKVVARSKIADTTTKDSSTRSGGSDHAATYTLGVTAPSGSGDGVRHKCGPQPAAASQGPTRLRQRQTLLDELVPKASGGLYDPK